MSVISNAHTIVPFVSGETKAYQDQRLAKIGYKPRDNKPAKFPSVAVSIPTIPENDIVDNVSRLLPAITTMLEGVQDNIIRGMYENSEGTLKTVLGEDIGIHAIIAYLEAETVGSRLTAEKIKEWFVDTLADPLTVYLSHKLGFGDDPNAAQLETIAKHVNAYRDTFAVLSGKMVFMEGKKINSLITALELINEEGETDIVTRKITAKLEELKNKPAIEELL